MGKTSREKRERRWQAEENAATVFHLPSGLEKICRRVIEWGVYLSLLTPLIVSKYFFFPYVSPKSIFFRIIVDVIFAAYVLLLIFDRKYLPKLNALSISLIVFFSISILASILGVNFIRSFWSTFERMTGLLTMFHLFVYFLVLTSVFRERKYWERFLMVSVSLGTLLSLYVFVSTDRLARGGGTLGNSDFLASYLLFNVFFALILFFTKKGGWKIFYGICLVPLIWLLLSPPQEPSQGVISAFWGGIFILFFGYLLFYLVRSGKKSAKILIPALIIFVILAGLGLSQTALVKDKVKEIASSSSWQARALIWQMGITAWEKRPWLGWGWENFNVPFAEYFNPSLPLTLDIWYDRVHNVVLDMMTQAGIIGLLSYLAIFGTAIFSLLKISKKIAEKRNLFLPLGLIALLAAYFAQNIWSFDMISTYVMFFFTLSFIYFLTFIKKEETETSLPERKGFLSPFAGALLVIMAVYALYFGNVQPAQSAFYLVRAISYPFDSSLNYFQKAIKTSQIGVYEGGEQFARKIGNLAYDPNVDRTALEQGFSLATEAMKESVSQNPLDFRVYLLIGRLYNDYFNVKGDNPEFLSLAEQYLNQGIKISPKNQQAYWALAQTRLSQSRPSESLALMQKAAALEPRYDMGYWYLGMTYKIFGDFKTALENIKEAERLGLNLKVDLAKLKQVIDVCQELADDQCLVERYPMAIKLDPQNAQFLAALAVSYANLGQYDMARQYANQAMSLNPSFKVELQAFLDQLPK